MFELFEQRASHAAKKAGRTVAIGLGALISLGVGCAFLTLSAWLFLVTVTEPAIAALIIGGVYTGAALILLARAGTSKSEKPAPAPTPDQPLPPDMSPLVAAFVTGIQAGARARS